MVKRLRERLDVSKVVLFGSYAEDKADKDSDMDILVVLKTRETGVKRYALVSETLEPRSLPIDIIAMTPREINKRKQMLDPFIMDILNNGRVLYDKKT